MLDKEKKIEDNISIDVINLFRHEKHDNTVKDIRTRFRLNKENEAIKDRIIMEIRNLFEQEKGNYDKPERVGNFWSRNYIEHQSN